MDNSISEGRGDFPKEPQEVCNSSDNCVDFSLKFLPSTICKLVEDCIGECSERHAISELLLVVGGSHVCTKSVEGSKVDPQSLPQVSFRVFIEDSNLCRSSSFLFATAVVLNSDSVF